MNDSAELGVVNLAMKTNGKHKSVTNGATDRMPVIPYAIQKTRALLNHKSGSVDEDETHAVKSLLYAAVEQTRIKADGLHSLQRMLRELFVIVTANGDLRDYERSVALQILDELGDRYGFTSEQSNESR